MLDVWVRKFEVFGAATTDRFDPETSDVDFVIEFSNYGRGVDSRFFRFAKEIERLLWILDDLGRESRRVLDAAPSIVQGEKMLVCAHGVG